MDFSKYLIKDSDSFDAPGYPRVVREIDDLQVSLGQIQSAYKTRIVISMLKDHSVKIEWIEGNKQLVTLLTSGSLSTSDVESLFSACKDNLKFMAALEAYISTRLA
jgi:hypothetical protein